MRCPLNKLSGGQSLSTGSERYVTCGSLVMRWVQLCGVRTADKPDAIFSTFI